MKPLLVCLVLVLTFSPSFAGAGNGNAGGNGNGNAYGHDNGNNGVGSANSTQGDGHADGGASDDSSVLSPGGLVTLGTDQNQALDAIGSGALPLSEIADRAVAQWGGRVIDAKLVRRGTALVYRLTLLSDAGISRRVFYDARTGASLGGQ